MPFRPKTQYQIKTQPVFVPPVDLKHWWYSPLSEPVRLPRRLPPGLNQDIFWVFSPPPAPPDPRNVPWFEALSEPIYPKKGLRSYLQEFQTRPPRVLPTPDITVTMAATEINSDIFLGAINVYDDDSSSTSGAGAKVSIVEIGSGGDPVSIEEE